VYFDEAHHKAVDGPTIAERLSEHGYDTAAVVTNAQLTPMKRFHRGFDSSRNLRVEATGDSFEPGVRPDDDDDASRLRGLLRSIRNQLIHGEMRDRLKEELLERWSAYMVPFVVYRFYQKRTQWPTVSGREVAEEIIATVRDAEDPFFLWGHFNDLHGPIHPDRAHQPGICEGPVLRQFVWDARRLGNVDEPGYRRMYDGALRYVDAQIGRVVKALRDADVCEETFLVVTSDHGEALHNRGVYGHATGEDRYTLDPRRCYMHDELLRVPLIVSTPERVGWRVETPFSLAWLHELIEEAVGLDLGEFPRQSARDRHLSPVGSEGTERLDGRVTVDSGGAGATEPGMTDAGSVELSETTATPSPSATASTNSSPSAPAATAGPSTGASSSSTSQPTGVNGRTSPMTCPSRSSRGSAKPPARCSRRPADCDRSAAKSTRRRGRCSPRSATCSAGSRPPHGPLFSSRLVGLRVKSTPWRSSTR
jgi:hypothetical protein